MSRRFPISTNQYVNKGRNDGRTPLYIAASKGHMQIVQLLIKSGADVSKCDDEGSTPLHVASQEGHYDIVKELISHGAQVDKRRSNGCTALYSAAEAGHSAIVSTLIQKNCNVNAQKKTGMTPLYVAAQNGHVEVVQQLLNHSKTEVDKAKLNQTTPLFVAAQKGSTYIVEMLLRNGSNPNLPRDDGITPLYVAVQNGYADCVVALIRQGAAIEQPSDKPSLLYVAAYKGHVDVVTALLQYGVLPQDTPLGGQNGEVKDARQPPLAVAAVQGHESVVRLLLRAGASGVGLSRDVIEKSEELKIEKECIETHDLPRACQFGFLAASRTVLASHPDLIDTPSPSGATPLNIALQARFRLVARLLVDQGASLESVEPDLLLYVFYDMLQEQESARCRAKLESALAKGMKVKPKKQGGKNKK